MATMKIKKGDMVKVIAGKILMNPPQKDFRLVGAVELPPTDAVPLISHGYMVMLCFFYMYIHVTMCNIRMCLLHWH